MLRYLVVWCFGLCERMKDGGKWATVLFEGRTQIVWLKNERTKSERFLTRLVASLFGGLVRQKLTQS